MKTSMSNTTLETANKAFQNWCHGLATGEWEPFLDMLTDDYTFWHPNGEYKGKNVGKERAAAFFEFVSVTIKAVLTVAPPYRVTSNEKTVVFEFEDEGHVGGEPYKNRLAISFDVRGDKISACREYYGEI